MPYLNFSSLTDALSDDLKRQYRDRLPFATVLALTRTAIACRDQMAKHMTEAFRDPVPYTLHATRAMPATKQTMASAVLLRDFGGKGNAAVKYLGAEILGGPRVQKRSERALAAIGILGANGYVVPGSAARRDSHGNQSRSEVIKILSALRAFSETGYSANRRGPNPRKAGQIFAVKQGSNRPGLKPGVYRRGAGNKVESLMKFVTRPAYRIRLPFDDLVVRDAEKIFPEQLMRALQETHD